MPVAHAYTPGLKVTERTVLRKRRMLPLKGSVLVSVGQSVAADDEVARAELPGRVHPLNLVNELGVSPSQVRNNMLKQEGEHVEADEVIAQTQSWFRFLRSQARSPISGTIETISDVTGQIMLREPPRPVVVKAYVTGKVVEVLEEEGAVVETRGAFAQGIFGIGGEQTGTLRTLDVPEDAEVTADALPQDCAGAILVGAAFVGLDALRQATERGAVGFITAGMDAEDLQKLLGYDIGVAVTGSEALSMTVILTEGFGRIPMAKRTRELLRRHAGATASINGATQIRAGVMRPEIIIPETGVAEAPSTEEPAVAEADGIGENDEVRIIREPDFGEIGRVSKLIAEPVTIETGASVRVLEIRLDDGRQVTVPRANVEVVEK